MRRLVAFVCLVVFVDTVFYAAITPILPELSDEYGLSKTGAGVLAAAYPAGTFVGALPGGWLAARAGVRPTVLLGLGLLVGSSLVFAFAHDIVVLDVARFVQGVGGAASWAGALGWLIGAAPRERRGELIGTALAAAIVGALFGPVLGALAGVLGQAPVFAGVAVMGMAMMVWAERLDPVQPEGDSRLRSLLTALGDRRVAGGMWLVTLPGLLFGTLAVLGPLRMDELGAGATAIAAAWLIAAALEAVINPLVGRLSDRRGRLAPSIAGVAGGALTMLALPWPSSAWVLGGLIVLAAPAIGALYTPAIAMLSDGAETLGVAQGFAFALVNLAWATGQTAGAAGSARLADATTDRVPYLVLAGACVLTLAVLVRQRDRVVVSLRRLMAAEIIDGKAIAQLVRSEVAAEVAAWLEVGHPRPGLATVLVGDDAASAVYVGGKQRASAEVGIEGFDHRLPADASHEDVERLLRELNDDPAVSGILLQLPTPPQVDGPALTELIDPAKDVDGLTPIAAGLLAKGRPGLRPCTPQGVMELLRRHDVELEGAEAVVVGRSDLVGKPLASLLLAANATVTTCHSRTRDLGEVCRRADVLVAAVGRAGLVQGGWVKEGAVVIDVGTNRTDAGLTGDVDFEEAAQRARLITPVPGGVGPMTIAMLLRNTLEAAKAAA